MAVILTWLHGATAAVAGAFEPADFRAIDEAVSREIGSGNVPGAVVLVGGRKGTLYRRAFGYRALEPEKLPMTEETIFDLASLTKAVATTTAVMQLAEQGKLALDDRVERYWPEFGSSGKRGVRVIDLLAHTSGLRSGFSGDPAWSGYRAALERIEAEKLLWPPGTKFLYSDLNFVALGELVARVSGLPFEVYCDRRIFARLGMTDSGFRPGPEKHRRIAPTSYRNGRLLWGEVHDPTASRMGGVSGHAGLFSSADDLALFARALLGFGAAGSGTILRPETISAMAAPRVRANGNGWWGLGWEVAPAFDFSANGSPHLAFGHNGFTGTSLWIDPDSRHYAIVLASRLHPGDAGDAKPLRAEVARIVARALGRFPAEKKEARQAAAGETAGAGAGPVRVGVDRLVEQDFAPLAGRRVGLITNHTGVDHAGRRTIDLLSGTRRVGLKAIFSPEHGLAGGSEARVPSTVEPVTRIPVHSLYGSVRRPAGRMLEGIDALVFDVQDAGARFYTYITTMAYAMEAAAKRGIEFFVLDRPNPINASAVQGPVLDPDLKSFTGYFPMPVRHGMTAGELAAMFNGEAGIGARLRVLEMTGYRRTAWYDETRLRWIGPSPNLPTLAAAVLYPGVAMVEAANVSVGRGTDVPFQVVGAPWIDGAELADYLGRRKIPGLSFKAASFTPGSDRYRDRLCHGVRLIVEDREQLDTPALGIELASALYRLYPGQFELEKNLALVGARWVLQAIKEGRDPKAIARAWAPSLEAFGRVRAKYLLYR
ncbi:MAG TPA: exo-beta-N-acetylmuramidase NamZ domain-containing protein [candidate division Zixibacteria bacterium]|nr:exo-beta-N-acetylmuramidase NamZ domain-containing protein [candidate division Zixibacteria bacterium]